MEMYGDYEGCSINTKEGKKEVLIHVDAPIYGECETNLFVVENNDGDFDIYISHPWQDIFYGSPEDSYFKTIKSEVLGTNPDCNTFEERLTLYFNQEKVTQFIIEYLVKDSFNMDIKIESLKSISK